MLPKYEQVKRELLALVAQGSHTPDRPFITQRGVCERYGVSTTTAIRALNDLVADGVLVRQQGRGTFVAERTAGPEPVRRRAVALVIHGQGPVKEGIIAGVESRCEELGFELVLYDSKGSLELQERALQRAVDSGVGGIALYPVEGSSAVLRELELPVVLIDRYQPDVPTDAVLADQYAVGYELTAYLIGLGHRRMAALWGEVDATSVRDRLSGHQQALRAHNLPIRPDLTALTTHQFLTPDARKARLAALLEQAEPPTVLLCSDGFIVTTAARDLAHLGYEVPGDIELAGMDDAGPASILPLTLAAASLPVHEMGRTAVDLLADPAPPRNVVLPITLHTRKSTYLRVVHS
ncbi:GntR family transcriptional regulator [Kribbella antibiotica]|uniref:GntR family transcriptional regulator n=1 Tax=Kribbella antibiotica TaxID=190195 RepID=A0A4R4YUP7_9ACTN|nr:GntR family transcriptional regulator [Kribbella antibiotica]TDD48490.1 GntR family transcriptional regulator [Kribbella antibiotica]